MKRRKDVDWLASFDTWQEAWDDLAAYLDSLAREDDETRELMGRRTRYIIRRDETGTWRVECIPREAIPEPPPFSETRQGHMTGGFGENPRLRFVEDDPR